MRIAHLGHAELRTPKLEESVEFFKNVLGLEETERTGQSVYMRAWGDWEHHTLILTAADRPGLEHVGWRVGAPTDVEAFAREIEASGETVTHVEAGTEKGQGDAVRFTYPGGQAMELYYDVEKFQPGALPLDPAPCETGKLKAILPSHTARSQRHALTSFNVSSNTEEQDVL